MKKASLGNSVGRSGAGGWLMEAVVDVKSCVEPEEFKKEPVEEEKELRDK